MTPRVLAAALALLTAVIGPQAVLLIAFCAALAAVAVLAFAIASVSLDTGWRLVPFGRLRR